MTPGAAAREGLARAAVVTQAQQAVGGCRACENPRSGRGIWQGLLRRGGRPLAARRGAHDSWRMEWQDEGVLIAMRLHGESAAIIEVFTAAHGRHLGVVRGGASRRMAAVLQPGSQVAVAWRARLEEHIGAFVVEPVRARAGVLADRLALSGLNAVCAMVQVALPEREAFAGLWGATMVLLDAMEAGAAVGAGGEGDGPERVAAEWGAAYLRWEVLLLEAVGFGLDLSRCAVTGSREDLAFVSPRSGRAVGRDAAGEWAAKLLPLPPVMLGQGRATAAELVQGLAVTGHFLARGLAPVLNGRALPEARNRLIALLARER